MLIIVACYMATSIAIMKSFMKQRVCISLRDAQRRTLKGQQQTTGLSVSSSRPFSDGFTNIAVSPKASSRHMAN